MKASETFSEDWPSVWVSNMRVFMIGVLSLQRLVLLEVQDNKVLVKEVAVAVGAIARRAMHEGDRDEEDERK